MKCPTCNKPNNYVIERIISTLTNPATGTKITTITGFLFRCMYCQNHFNVTIEQMLLIVNDYFTITNKVHDLIKLLDKAGFYELS